MVTRPAKKPLRPNIKRHRAEKGAIDLVEEAFHLLRRSSFVTLSCYYIGSMPFILALLYFWTDMSRSAYAEERCAEAAFGLALLFVWMKSWQAAFAQRLKESLQHVPFSPYSWRRVWHLTMTQAIIQSWGMLLLPCSLLIGAPFPWLYAFYQNATAFGSDEHGSVKHIRDRAWQQAKLWPKQNCLLIWLLSPWLLIASVAALIFAAAFVPKGSISLSWGFFMITGYLVVFGMTLLNPIGGIVAANIGAALYLLPQLLKMLFGVETMFTMSPAQMFNSTFWAVVCSLTYLCLDPLVKAAYVARCFYGEALHTGEDLKVEIRSLSLARKAAASVVLLALALSITFGAPAFAATSNSPTQDAAPSVISSQALDESLDHVLSQPEYAWRMPQERASEDEKKRDLGFLKSVFDTFERWGKTIKKWFDTVNNWLSKLKKWYRKLFPDQPVETPISGGHGGGLAGVQVLLYLLLALIACATAIFVWRIWRKRRQMHAPLETAPDANAEKPDLTDENVDASQLPADNWLTLAHEMIERGEFRLALRAFYLAGLAYLGEQRLVVLTKYKSDREYEQELRRRAHAFPALLPVFRENMLAYQRSWYGMRDVERAALDRAIANYEQLRQATVEKEK